MDITAAIAFCVEHYDEALAVLGALVAAATVIVKITPSQADDAILGKVVKLVDWLSVVNPKGTKVIKTEEAQAKDKAEAKTEILPADKA